MFTGSYCARNETRLLLGLAMRETDETVAGEKTALLLQFHPGFTCRL
jgi:hypothetical protein